MTTKIAQVYVPMVIWMPLVTASVVPSHDGQEFPHL
jgi:hypothetical protein